MCRFCYIIQGKFDVVHQLLLFNAHIDIQDSNGDTALVKVQHFHLLNYSLFNFMFVF